MNRLRFQTRGLAEPLRRSPCRRTEQALHAFGTEDHQDRVHERCLADSWPSGDDHHPIRENRFQCFPLTGGEHFASALLTPCDRLLEWKPKFNPGPHPMRRRLSYCWLTRPANLRQARGDAVQDARNDNCSFRACWRQSHTRWSRKGWHHGSNRAPLAHFTSR